MDVYQDVGKGGLSLRGGGLHDGFGGFEGSGGSGEHLALFLLVLQNAAQKDKSDGFGSFSGYGGIGPKRPANAAISKTRKRDFQIAPPKDRSDFEFLKVWAPSTCLCCFTGKRTLRFGICDFEMQGFSVFKGAQTMKCKL